MVKKEKSFYISEANISLICILTSVSPFMWIPNTSKTNDYKQKKRDWLDEADCISHSTNTLGKGMNPIILPPAMGK